MERLTNARPNRGICTICGARRTERETWFLVTENKWQDRLNIWRWNAQMAGSASVHCLCTPWHVRELVVHWMTTGGLSYPFASGKNYASQPAELNSGQEMGIPPEHQPAHLGEIAVDRDGLCRVLQENPLMLNTILSELIAVLENELPENAEIEPEDEESLVAPRM